MRKVDIIIPVYNALDDLKICLESVKRNTDLSKHRVLILNDNSSDEHVWPYLQSVESEGILVFNNSKNLGFSGNINKGILNSDRDVLLLNSDTIVTSNWVEKIIECAYSSKGIGTVTPLSNNATICSVPRFCEENKLPEGFELDEYAMLIEKYSMKKYSQIPVAHGFCMFIKREVIDLVGLFDADTFGRGYGEENDFCHRAGQLGYKHVVCDNTYIFHTGTSSFQSTEKLQYIAEHADILRERYPKQERAVSVYCATNPNEDIIDNIKVHTMLSNGRKNVLYFLHSDFRKGASDNVGGTQLHVKDLKDALCDQFNIIVAARNDDNLNITVYSGNKEVYFQSPIPQKSEYAVFSDTGYYELYEWLLRVFQVDVIHVHHILGLSYDIFEAAKDLGIPYFITLHDYYYMCPNEKLFNHVNRFCDCCTDEKICQICLGKKRDIAKTVPYKGIWQAQNLKVLSESEMIFTPSNDAKDRYTSVYPFLENKIKVIEHGLDFENSSVSLSMPYMKVTNDVCCFLDEWKVNKYGQMYIVGWAYNEHWPSDEVDIFIEFLRDNKESISFKAIKNMRYDVANGDKRKLHSGFKCIIPIEKYEILQNLEMRVVLQFEYMRTTDGQTYKMKISDFRMNNKFLKARKQNIFNVAFIGGLSLEKGAALAYEIMKEHPDNIHFYIFGNTGYAPLDTCNFKNVTKVGSYKREDLGYLIQQYEIDLGCLLPIWPETFCYTLSEALLAGVPVLATNIGALGERVKKMNCGLTLSVDASAKDILREIIRLQKNSTELMEYKNNIQLLSMRTIRDMAQDYAIIYDQISKINHEVSSEDNQKLMENQALNTDSTATIDDAWLRHLLLAESELNAIKNANTYKFMKSLDHMKIPFKGTLRKVVRYLNA